MIHARRRGEARGGIVLEQICYAFDEGARDAGFEQRHEIFRLCLDRERVKGHVSYPIISTLR